MKSGGRCSSRWGNFSAPPVRMVAAVRVRPVPPALSETTKEGGQSSRRNFWAMIRRFLTGLPPWSVEDEAASAEDGGEAGFQRIGEFAELGEDEGFFAARGDFGVAVTGAGEKRIKLNPAFHGLLARRGRFPARAGSAGRADILPASTARIPRAAGPRNGGDRAGVSTPDRSGRRA